jgi:hypothetical protein
MTTWRMKECEISEILTLKCPRETVREVLDVMGCEKGCNGYKRISSQAVFLYSFKE